ncbi:MAG: aspartate 1-decarboxylase [Candidatus Omnitrophota bacterium]
MLRTILKSKIHKAHITEANLHYAGSITIDEVLLRKSDILEWEKVEVLNLNNGSRLETYAIKGKKNSGRVCLNGPAARSGAVGDEIIIVSYATIDDRKAASIKPKIIHVDANNRPKSR